MVEMALKCRHQAQGKKLCNTKDALDKQIR